MTVVQELAPAPTSVDRLQNVCIPVKGGFGDPASPDTLEMLQDEDYADVAEDVATKIEQDPEHFRYDQSYDRQLEFGELAGRAIKSVGCCACKLSGICTVYRNLLTRVEVGQANREFAEAIDMLSGAPKWLTAARINQSSASVEEMQLVAFGDRKEARRAVDAGEVDLEELLCKTDNKFEGVTNKKELPELANKSSVDPDTMLESHRITTVNGQEFDVIDASDAVNFKDSPLSAADYGILCGKLLKRMSETDAQGRPQILSADNTMQKGILTENGSTTFEMRMSGSKNRLYFTTTPATETESMRIVILGSHGGDYSTQESFIKNIIRKP